jgi:hypothetical protein
MIRCKILKCKAIESLINFISHQKSSIASYSYIIKKATKQNWKKSVISTLKIPL